ncbi:MAG: hypothetical protein WBO09_06070 [Methylocystis silviterrae]|uniref:hypothetical protein n=1 Tax=Methylocystis silviterrae TaxID=2743612 RepID=UPI003C725D50
MRDDDEPGSGSGLLWYEVGHSDGYYSGESFGLRQGKSRGYDAGWSDAVRQINARQENERRNGVRTIHINYYNSLINDLNQRGQQIADLQGEIRDLEQQLESSRDSTSRENEAKQREGLYGDSVKRCLHRLLKAAEQGKTHYPEYQELRGIMQQLFDAAPISGRKESMPLLKALDPRIDALGDALER